MIQDKPIPPADAEAPFAVGQPVTRRAYIDGSGREQPALTGLTVESVTLERCYSIPSYWRLSAKGPGISCESAAQNFDAA